MKTRSNYTPLDKPLDKFVGLFIDKDKSAMLDQIFYTKLGRLIIFFILAAICGILTNLWYWMYIPLLIFLIYPIQLTFILMAYAWVINPINNHRDNKLYKKNMSERISLINNGAKKLVIQYPADVVDDTLFLHFLSYYDNNNQNEWNEIYSIAGYEFKNLKVSYIPFFITDNPIKTVATITFDEARKK